MCGVRGGQADTLQSRKRKTMCDGYSASLVTQHAQHADVRGVTNCTRLDEKRPSQIASLRPACSLALASLIFGHVVHTVKIKEKTATADMLGGMGTNSTRK